MINPQNPTPRYIRIKFQITSDKENTLMQLEKHTQSIPRNKGKIIGDSLSETMRSRKKWKSLFKALKEKSYQCRTLILAKTFYRKIK